MILRRGVLLGMVVAAAVGGAACWGDTVELTDGRVLEGEIGRKGEQMVVTQVDGVVVPIRSSDLKKVTLSETRSPAQLAQADWERAVQQIKKSDNLGDIIRLHKVMLTAYGEQAIAETIRESLAGYEKMATGDYVKFRSQWVPRLKVEVMLRQADEKAKQALDLYHASRLKDALETANEALKLDEENATALSIGGLATYRQNQLSTARGYFSRLAAADNANVLAWNNLAVIANDQKHAAESLLDYTRALAALPDNRLVLDNITEALNGYPGSREMPLYLDLVRQYNLAEAKMEAKLAKVNLYRLGSTWVSKEDRDKMNTSLADVRKGMTELEAKYQEAVKTLSTIDDQVKAATDTINTSTGDYNNATGTLLVLQTRGVIDPYWNDVRDRAYQNVDQATKQRTALEQQKVQLTASVKQMRVDAAKLKGAMGTNQAGQFTGFQRIMELGEAENPPAPILVDPSKVSGMLGGGNGIAGQNVVPPAVVPARVPLPPPLNNGVGYAPPVFYDGPGGWWPPGPGPVSPGPTPTPTPKVPTTSKWKTFDSLN